MTVLYFNFTLSGIPAFHTEQRSSLSIGPWVAHGGAVLWGLWIWCTRNVRGPWLWYQRSLDCRGFTVHAVTRDSMEQNLTNCGIVDLEQVSTRTGTRKQSHDGVAKASSLSWRAQRCRMSLTSETWNRPRCVRREMRLVRRCEVRGELGNPSAEICSSSCHASWEKMEWLGLTVTKDPAD